MKAVIQRVSQAEVRVNGERVSAIGQGLLVLLCILKEDTEADLQVVCEKLPRLRVFSDEQGKMNRSLLDVGGEMLVISQFTLAADLKKGLRPSFDRAADPERAKFFYEKAVGGLRKAGVPVRTGVFGAMMQVSLTNEGPVTLMLDTKLNNR